ncbi:MAG TPA: SDR family NAD(P)-dependent oxidoreductase [Oligoflexia bacterium]|nr:SDR family NAD(P)-dependent oxidoreductase [Oligoflexia bacterium]HMR23793.1 SDR family NAD(P)-dependent oxidoreductase [Oligoflexia bacterium]
MNKTVIITGASSGFGYETAKKLHHEGYTLILGARRTEKLKHLQLLLGEERCFVHQLDVQDTQSVQNFKDFTDSKKLQISGLINNAGLALGKDSLVDSDEKDILTMLDTNVLGIFRMCKSFIPILQETAYSQIINIGSIAGHEAYPKGAGYCASKFAVKALTQSLRQELLTKKIKVSSIDPGLANTEFSIVRHKGNQNLADATYNNISPLHAKDIADAVYFVLSRPKHVNIDQMLIMPSQQANAHMLDRSGEIE